MEEIKAISTIIRKQPINIQYFNLINSDEKLRQTSSAQELKLNDIQYNPQQDHNQFFIHLLHHSKNYRTLTIRVILGPFATVITIFNDSSTSFIHELNCLYGCCGNVYLIQWGSQQKIAIKCIQMKDGYSSTFLRTIKQYTINKIASALRIGPKIIKVQQFDLIVYQKCIEFFMEKCSLPEEHALTEEDHIILKKKLRLLHQLKIVHCDIKPSNIVFSENFKSPVFLDFGFSKILSTGPGEPVKTKFIGSLESCSKQMVELYISKRIGKIDLYYNDAYALDIALKSDPIRQTGNDLEEIVKFCDPTLSSFHFIKIFYSLYNDQIFNATNELLLTRRGDKKFKIMGFLDMLTPTQNLREFYFKFFEQQWKDSIQFYDFVRRYNHSHRHQLQLNLQYRPDSNGLQSKTPNVFCYLIQHVFNIRINLFDLDNDFIDFGEQCIGLRKYYSNKFETVQEKYDFFLSHIGILNQNYFIKEKQFKLLQQIYNNFYQKLPEAQKKAHNDHTKLVACFQHLIHYCLQPPITLWKLRTFQRSINEEMTMRKIHPAHFEKYMIIIINLNCQLSIKANLLLSLINSLTYQIAVWGNYFNNEKNGELSIQKQIDRIQSQYYKLSTENNELEKMIKLDLFLFKHLIRKINPISSIQIIEKSFFHLMQQDRNKRINILNFIKIMYLYNLGQYEECRLQIQRTFSVSQIPIVFKPQYFLLFKVYYMLNNGRRCKQLIQLIDENILVKEIINDNANLVEAIEFIKQQKFLLNTWGVKLKSIENPYDYLSLILRRYFQIKNKKKLTQLQKYHQIILSITKDNELIECLENLSKANPTQEDKIRVYERLLNYYYQAQFHSDKEEGQKIRQKYTKKLQLKCYWLKNQYNTIIESIDKDKLCKINYLIPICNDPILFDFLIKSYIMLNKIDKVTILIRSLEDSFTNKIMLIEKWIETVSFTLLFQAIMEKCLWNDFRQLLIAIVDFIDIHPTSVYINSYICCLRYAYSQKIDITHIDNGLSTISFPGYQWKYPLLSFFHIEALIKMTNLHDYLNKNQLQLYMWRVTSFLPFLKHAELKWFLQEYYAIALKMKHQEKYRKFILRKCRSLINYFPQFKKNNYFLKHIKLIQNNKLIEVILEKTAALDDFIEQQNGVKLSNFKNTDTLSQACHEKLANYHINSGNFSMKIILNNYKQLMRLKLQEQ